MPYAGRPGLSPAVAALVATGRIRRSHAILDVGCGTGTDARVLASWGFRRVVGIDPDARAIAVARAQATRAGLGRRVRFDALAAEGLLGRFGPGRFDVALHTLVANNLRRGQARHFANVAAVLKDEGLLVLHERLSQPSAKAPPGGVAPLSAVRRHFRLTPSLVTHLAERGGGRGPPYALVALWLGTPRAGGEGRVRGQALSHTSILEA